MEMKTLFKYAGFIAGVALGLSACQKWTETVVQHPINLTETVKSEKYYEDLRAYKESDHSVAFGWFGNWVGTGISMENSMMGLPDSVDFVSMWGGWANPSKEKLEDFHKVRELKGTKALVCFLEGESFEDVIRNCISIGGDSDTIAAIAGGIAEAFFGVSKEDRMMARTYLDDRLIQICDAFSSWLKTR